MDTNGIGNPSYKALSNHPSQDHFIFIHPREKAQDATPNPEIKKVR
jgi:hypothetical protein